MPPMPRSPSTRPRNRRIGDDSGVALVGWWAEARDKPGRGGVVRLNHNTRNNITSHRELGNSRNTSVGPRKVGMNACQCLDGGATWPMSSRSRHALFVPAVAKRMVDLVRAVDIVAKSPVRITVKHGGWPEPSGDRLSDRRVRPAPAVTSQRAGRSNPARPLFGDRGGCRQASGLAAGGAAVSVAGGSGVAVLASIAIVAVQVGAAVSVAVGTGVFPSSIDDAPGLAEATAVWVA